MKHKTYTNIKYTTNLLKTRVFSKMSTYMSVVKLFCELVLSPERCTSTCM